MAVKYEKLTYINGRGESVVFSRASDFHINMKDVTGLSDVSNTIYSVSSMGQDGDTLVGTRVEARDIQIAGHFKSTRREEILELGRRLNRVINPHQTATLIYEYDGKRRKINCLPRNAPVIKRKVGQLYDGFVLQLTCLNPYWREVNQTRTDVAAWLDLMEFPTETSGLEITQNEWQIGERTQSVVANVINAGDVDTGLRVSFIANGTVVEPMLTDMQTGEYIKINTTLESGDELVVTTGYGEKAVVLIRDGAESNVFRMMDVDSTYLQLRPGDNLYRYDAESGVEALDVIIRHSNLYLGV